MTVCQGGKLCFFLPGFPVRFCSVQSVSSKVISRPQGYFTDTAVGVFVPIGNHTVVHFVPMNIFISSDVANHPVRWSALALEDGEWSEHWGPGSFFFLFLFLILFAYFCERFILFSVVCVRVRV